MDLHAVSRHRAAGLAGPLSFLIHSMKFSDLEDGNVYFERFKRELKTELEGERQERSYKRIKAWADRMPWIVAGLMGWIFFFFSMISHR
jgi:hypothetical protein